MQVAVKKLHTSSAPVAAAATFLDEIQTLQLASATCQRACRMLGCCKLDGDVCIVMSLHPKSADKRLEESQGDQTGSMSNMCNQNTVIIIITLFQLMMS